MGWFRGLVTQLASITAIVGGIAVGDVTKQWVGHQWQGAHPTVVFGALTWFVTVLAALAAFSLLSVLGDRLSEAVHEGPLAWLDRSLGVLAGACLGVVFGSLVVLGAAQLPVGHFVDRAFAEARSPSLLMSGGVEACSRLGRVPGARGLKKQFAFASRRWARETPAM